MPSTRNSRGRRFSELEWERVTHLFKSLAAQSRSRGRAIIASVFQSFFGIHGALGARLFAIASRAHREEGEGPMSRDDSYMSFEDFVAIMAIFDKGSPEEQNEVAYRLVNLLGHDRLTRVEAEEAVRSALLTWWGPQLTLSDAAVKAIVNSATFTENAAGTTAAAGGGGGGERGGGERKGVRLFEADEDEEEEEGEKERGRGGAAAAVERPANVGGVVGGGEGRVIVNNVRLKGEGRAEPHMSRESFVKWCGLVPATRRFLRSILTTPSMRPTPPLLVCSKDMSTALLRRIRASGTDLSSLDTSTGSQHLIPEQLSSLGLLPCPAVGAATLLTCELTWHLAGGLQDKECRAWRLVYSSAVNGLSYTTMLAQIGEIDGPTILLIRDKGGAVFGMFASQQWERYSSFYGDLKTFLFSFLPAAAIYRASGANFNVQWCASGFASETIPNGIGAGGQPGHFGLFIADDMEKGHSRECSTFGSPSLSSTPSFQVDTVECWAILDMGQVSQSNSMDRSSGGRGEGGNTVLDRFGQDRAMLGLMGIATASENVGKEPDFSDDDEEEM